MPDIYKHLIPLTGTDRHNDSLVISGSPKGGTYQFLARLCGIFRFHAMPFAGSGLPAYMKSSKKIFGKNTSHVRHIHLAGKRDRDNHNNKMERLNGEIMDREKVFRGLKRFSASFAWILATFPRGPAKVCFPLAMNLSFQSWNVAGEMLCLRHNSAADVLVFKNSSTILAFSCGMHFLLIPILLPPMPKNIRI